MLHQSVITLRMIWDDKECSNPKDWDWTALLDLPDIDHVEVLNGREIPIEDSPTV